MTLYDFIENQFGDRKMSSFSSPGAGGGFLDGTFGESPASQQRMKKEKKSTAVVPITVAGILNAKYQSDVDAFVLNEASMHQVTFIGMVLSVTENRTHLSFEIGDLTGGIVSVKRWLDQDENAEEYERARFREDTYVRVLGNIKRLDDDKKHVVAFAMRHVTDFNEITFHMYDVIHAALSMQKRVHEEAVTPDTTTNFGNNNSFSAQRNQFGPQIGNMSQAQKRVYEMVNQAKSQEGIYVDDLVKRLNMPEQSVRYVPCILL
ncbi:Hypothetical predicted protein [Paramuricea clavata]|uniref:Uncharacterized protein n=2 Tax=Paramuricea clavata TaxID=317549 RepID=A0A7D9HDL5_PARCT|nr:Hypothetical predicted protein [Paramuricea clavata]